MVIVRDGVSSHGGGNAGAGASGVSGAPDSDSLTSPTNLRKLVLNYLVHHCYTDTAHALARDGVEMGASAAVLAGSSSSVSISGSKAGSSSRGPTRSAAAHSSPLLSRSDSSTEVEVDSLLSVARGQGQAAVPLDGEADAAMHDGEANTGAASMNGGGTRSGKRTLNGGLQESHDAANVDFGDLTAKQLQTIRIRRDIRDHILHGRIRHAIDLLNMHFPSVLNGTSDAGVPGPSKGSTAYSRTSAGIDKSSRTSRGGATSRADAEEGDGKERALPAYPTSLDPSHLFLNLQIQLFIEMLRSSSSSSSTSASSMAALASSQTFEMTATTPASSSSHGGSGGLPSLPSLATSTPGIASASRAASPAPSSASSTGSVASSSTTAALNPTLAHALAHAQTLFARVAKLPVKSRVLYMKELDDVTGLLAYKDIERSPLASFLSTPRKMALAEQVNSAIMFSLGQPSQPLLESAVRQTTFVWRQLATDKAQLPHGSLAPSPAGGIGTIVTGASGSAGGSSSAGAAGKSREATSRESRKAGTTTRLATPWDFHTFLSEQ